MNIAYSKEESFTDKWHYIVTDTPGYTDFIKSTIAGASQADVAITMVSADGNSTTEIAKAAPTAPEDHRSSGAAGPTKMRMLGLSESDFTKNLKERSLEEDEAENGYQKDTRENNVTKASTANGTLYVLDFELSVILATFVRYIQKTTSPIRLVPKAVATLSKNVCLDSETCSESNLNSDAKCRTRRYVSLEDGFPCDCRELLSFGFGFQVWNSFNFEHC